MFFCNKKQVIMLMKTDIEFLLKSYQNIFSKPQMQHFATFVTGLSACDKPSISRISELHDRDRSCMNRFLTESPWEIEQVKSAYHKQIEPFIVKGSALLIDDTNSKRPYAKKVEKANYHYDHTTGKDVLGYCLVTSTISSGEYTLPYNIVPYYRKPDCNERKFMTKNDLAEQIILSSKNNQNITEVIFDTWYSNEQVIGACKKARKDYITQIKSNRNVTINRHKNAVRAFVKDIPYSGWLLTLHNNEAFRYFATSAFISSIGSIHLIFCQMYNDSKKEWGKTHYIISNLLDSPSNIVLHKYLNRTGIEGFHRDAKQNLGLEGYFLRNNRGIERYLFLVMIAYGFLAMLNMINNSFLSIGELCEEQKVNVIKKTFQRIKRNPEVENALIKALAKARV